MPSIQAGEECSGQYLNIDNCRSQREWVYEVEVRRRRSYLQQKLLAITIQIRWAASTTNWIVFGFPAQAQLDVLGKDNVLLTTTTTKHRLSSFSGSYEKVWLFFWQPGAHIAEVGPPSAREQLNHLHGSSQAETNSHWCGLDDRSLSWKSLLRRAN